MRWLFLFVLTLNLAYLGWQVSQTEIASSAKVPPLNNAPSIILLSEVRNNQPSGPVTTQAQQETTQNITPEAIPTVTQGSAELPVVAAAAVDKTSEIEPASELVDGASDVPGGDSPPEKAAQSRSCYTMGPFRDLDTLRSLTREIKSYVVVADFRGHEETEQSIYWVYIKPEKSFDKALETAERLKANKIKDFYIIREGENINGISLGHFRNKKGALRLAKKAEKLGFDVQADPVFKTYTVYWLDYELAGGVSIPEAILDKYIRTSKTDEISRLSRDCET